MTFDIRRNSKKQLIKGVSQYEYLESLGSKLTREARQVLDTFLYKWSWTNIKTPNLEGAKEREAAHALWRKLRTRAWTMKIIHSSTSDPNLYVQMSRMNQRWRSRGMLRIL